jgi:hypothetical protein
VFRRCPFGLSGRPLVESNAKRHPDHPPSRTVTSADSLIFGEWGSLSHNALYVHRDLGCHVLASKIVNFSPSQRTR